MCGKIIGSTYCSFLLVTIFIFLNFAFHNVRVEAAVDTFPECWPILRYSVCFFFFSIWVFYQRSFRLHIIHVAFWPLTPTGQLLVFSYLVYRVWFNWNNVLYCSLDINQIRSAGLTWIVWYKILTGSVLESILAWLLIRRSANSQRMLLFCKRRAMELEFMHATDDYSRNKLFWHPISVKHVVVESH